MAPDRGSGSVAPWLRWCLYILYLQRGSHANSVASARPTGRQRALLNQRRQIFPNLGSSGKWWGGVGAKFEKKAQFLCLGSRPVQFYRFTVLQFSSPLAGRRAGGRGWGGTSGVHNHGCVIPRGGNVRHQRCHVRHQICPVRHQRYYVAPLM